MNSVKAVQYEVSKMIQKAKEDYYFKIGHRLSDPGLSMKLYWSVLNRLLNRKNSLSIPPLLDNGLFLPIPCINILSLYLLAEDGISYP